jgi:predicted dienelactone hydrolase
MTPLRLLVIATLCLRATLTHAAGFAFIEVPADGEGPALHGAVWTPCDRPATPISLGGMTLSGVRDCVIKGMRLPLVVVSHGSGGSFLGHHDTAEALADAGFVVAAISHPGDNFKDLSRQQHLSIFASRPTDLRRLVDYMQSTWTAHAVIAPGGVGIFGFSRGGYAGLVAAGAVPDFSLRQNLCPPGSEYPMCVEFRRGEIPPVPRRDVRVKALVIADPGTAFDAKGLQKVTVPMQLWSSEFGGDGVSPGSVTELRRELPVAPEWHLATGAGHFAFLAPCPPQLADEMPELCRDKPGFDRAAFHAGLDAQVVSFFKIHLAPS